MGWEQNGDGVGREMGLESGLDTGLRSGLYVPAEESRASTMPCHGVRTSERKKNLFERDCDKYFFVVLKTPLITAISPRSERIESNRVES